MPYPKFIDIPEGERFSNMFGAVEMEKTARKIYQTLKAEKKWDTDLWMEDFMDDEDTRIGLFMLAIGGWMDGCETSGSFYMGEGFADRIVSCLRIDVTRRHLAVSKD